MEAFVRNNAVVVGVKPAIAKAAARRLTELMTVSAPSQPATTVANSAESVESGPTRDAEGTTARVAPTKMPVMDRSFYDNPIPSLKRDFYDNPIPYLQKRKAEQEAAIAAQIADVNRQNEELRRSYQERYQYHLNNTKKEIALEQAAKNRVNTPNVPVAPTP